MQMSLPAVSAPRLKTHEAMAVYEARLQFLWQHLDCSREYRLADRRRLTVRSPGESNTGAGPDFLNAGIMIDGRALTGAVEIHHLTSNWFQHHHHLDSRYREVVLHVVEHDDMNGDPRCADLPPVLTFEQLKAVPEHRRRLRHKCHLMFAALADDSVRSILVDAGLERLERKVRELLQEALDVGLNHALLLGLGDALGYRNNRAAFAGLVARFMSYPEEIRQRHFMALLWGESGLLPDPAVTPLAGKMLAFVREVWLEWSMIRTTAREPLPWVRHGNRPYNSPERRVAALVALVKKSGGRPAGWLAGVAEDKSSRELARELVDTLTLSDPLWNGWTTFETKVRKPAVILGHDRALELAVNAVLPALLASGRLAVEAECGRVLEARARDTWLELSPPVENQIVRRVCSSWFADRPLGKILHSAAAVQGVLHLYREFCESCQSDCLSCRLYNSW